MSALCVRCGEALDGVVLATDRLALRSVQLGRQCRDCAAVFCLKEAKALGAKLGDWMLVTCPQCGSIGGLTGALVAVGSPVRAVVPEAVDEQPALTKPRGEQAALVAKLAKERWRADPVAAAELVEQLVDHVAEIITETLAGNDEWGGVLQIARVVELGAPWPLEDVSPGNALAQMAATETGSIEWVRALARVEMVNGAGETIPVLLDVLTGNQSTATRATAAVYLGSITSGDTAVAGLTEALLDDGWFGREQVPEFGGPGLAAQLISGGFSVLERTKTMYVQQIAEKALEVLNAHPDTAVLIAGLASEDTKRRRYAARALGWLGDPGDRRVPEALANAESDPSRPVAKAAKKALERFDLR